MRCPSCQAENREGRRFCAECGVPLASVCAACGFSNEPGEKFCGGCGQPLQSPGPESPSPKAYTPPHLAEKILTSRSALEGERKQVTVLFCDIVDSTRLAGRLDPEVMHEVMDRVLRLMSEAVHRYEGTVNQFLGDGLMALFGAPVALEDHALRAVEAALAVQETIGGYSEDLKRDRGAEIRLRIGLNTGLVVVGKIGDDLRMDYTAVGDTTNLAARMQGLAEPGDILVTDATHRLVEGYVRGQSLGLVHVKGVSEPVPAHRITGRRRRTRLDVSAERGLSPLVGRDRELELLRDRFARVKDGRGQVVGIVGEPGVGKSRLLHEFRRSLEGERITWLAGHCVAYGQAVPYLPTLEVLRSNFLIEDGDNPHQIDEKLRRGLRALDPSLETGLPFLRDLFGLPADDSLEKPDAKVKRQKTFEAIRALTVAGSQRTSLVVVTEDLHWIDKTSEDYLAFLVESLTGLRVLLLMTHRPGYSARWADKTYYTQIALDLLSETDTEAVVRGLLRSPDLPPGLVQLIHEKAEGNPLFVEEITRSLLERQALVSTDRGTRWAGEARVEFPETAQDLIRARIDRLEEPVKRIAQTAAVIGREFGLPLLSRLDEPAGPIQHALDALRGAELIYERRFFPEVEYTFKHAIIQDVAYQSILVRRRRELHRAIGRAIEELYADRLGDHYELLAHHFSLAEEASKAVEYLLKAAGKAAAAFANREALALYERALRLLEPGSAALRADTLQKLSHICFFYLADGDASRKYAEAALEIYQRLDDKPNVLAMHMHLQTMYLAGYRDGATEDHAIPHLEALAALTEGEPDSVQKGLVYQRTAHLYLHRGEPITSLSWVQRAVDLFGRLQVPMGTSMGTVLTYLGRVDEGIAQNEKNWEPVLKGGNLIVIAVLGHELVHTLALARDVRRAKEWGERVLLEVTKGSVPHFEALLRRPLLLAYTLAGDVTSAEATAEAVASIESGTFLGCIHEDGAAVGLHYLRRGEHDRTRAYLEHRIEVHKARNNMAAVGACALVLGQLELDLGHYAAAHGQLERSLAVCRGGGNVLFELWVLPVLSELFMRTGQHAKGAECVRRGFDLLAPDRNWYGLPGPLHRARGMLAAAERKWDDAARAFEQAVAVHRQHGLPWDEAKDLYEWGLMCRARGDPADRAGAREKLDAALEIFQRIGARKDAEKVLAAVEG